MDPAAVFVGDFSKRLKRSLLRRLRDFRVRSFVRRRQRILARTAFGSEIFIKIRQNNLRDVQIWFHEDALSPRAAFEFRQLHADLATVVAA